MVPGPRVPALYPRLCSIYSAPSWHVRVATDPARHTIFWEGSVKRLLLAASMCSLALLLYAASAGASTPPLKSPARTDTVKAHPAVSRPGPLAILALRQATLTASDGRAVDFFGYSVALAGDTALVGVRNRTVGSNAYQGAAYVFVRSGSTWTQEGGELTVPDGAAKDTFGSSVAIDGDTALIGAPSHQVSDNAAQGAAYVFVRSGNSWTQQGAVLTAPDGAANDTFGSSVAVDGDTALVGAPSHQVGSNAYQGAAYVFVRSGSTWNQQGGALTALDGAANDIFGSSVAIDGDTALMGAPSHQVGAKALQGAAYVFVRSGGAWSQRGGALTASGGAANDSFGSSVALDGDMALIGAPYHTVGSNAYQGAAYVFIRSGSAWSQQGGALTTTTSRDGFGFSVALAGNRALVGSPLDFVGKNIQGSAYLFVHSGSTWIQQGGALATANDGVHDYFGSTVALSGDAALIGAPYHRVGSNADQGGVYVYQLPSTIKPRLGAPAAPRTVKHGNRFTVSGTLAPHFRAGSKTVTVKAYRYVSHEWRLYKSYSAVNAAAGSASKYVTRLKLSQTGTYRFGAFTAATMKWAAARSGISRTLTVK
jgi:FG-GAP repeat